MSKITPKNLSYDASLPPFLQRMRGEFTSNDGRHERAIARPKRARNTEAEEEDEPTYVDEITNSNLSKEEYTALVKDKSLGNAREASVDKKNEKDSEAGEGKNDETKELKEKEKEKVAAIGAARKRKVGRVIGAEDDMEDQDASIKAAVTKAALLTGNDKKKVGVGAKPEKIVDGPKKKKAKKIKLSFGDGEEGG